MCVYVCVCVCACVCSNKTAKAEQEAYTLRVCMFKQESQGRPDSMHSACVCVCMHVCSNKMTKAEQEAYTLHVCVFKQESQGRPDSMHSACVCACTCVCSNKPVSQDTQNLISRRQLTVFKNRLLPMTFPSPLFCSDSKPAHSLLSYEPNSRDGPGCQWEAVLLA